MRGPRNLVARLIESPQDTAPNRTENGSELQVAYESFLSSLPVKTPKRILFINIPHVPADLFLEEIAKTNGYQNYPPMGYLVLAAAAREAIPDVELSILDLNHKILMACHQGNLGDLNAYWKGLITQEIGQGDELHICVGNNWAVLTPIFLEITRFIRDTFPQVTVVTGGVETTQNYQRLVEGNYCHIAFRHNSEFELKAFLNHCAGIGSTPVPKGVAFTTGNLFYESETGPVPTQFLDIRPYYHLIDIEKYHKYGGMNPFSRYIGKNKVYGTVLTNRGCRASCSFCAVKAFYPNAPTSRPIANVVDEIRYLMEKKGVKLIDILDDDLAYGYERSVELFKSMAEDLPAGLEWMSNNGITGSSITEEVMYWMAKSGCKAFKVGVESGNEARLRSIKKPASKDSLRKAGVIFRKYPDVFVNGNYMLGFPNETFSEMIETFDFANELAWDWSGFFICQPSSGTPMFSAFEALGDERCEADNFGGLIPSRFAKQTETFGYYKGYHSDDEISRSIFSGKEIFNIPKDHVPSAEQLKEIWFTFNLITNFFNNRHWKPNGDITKIVRWFETILDSYPRDASMCAMLAYGHNLMGEKKQSRIYRSRFHSLLEEYSYWRRRVEEFPELLEYAG